LYKNENIVSAIKSWRACSVFVSYCRCCHHSANVASW